MKVNYYMTINLIVDFGNGFNCTIKECRIDKIRETVEDLMWDHHFDTADVVDAYSGELIMDLKKDC